MVSIEKFREYSWGIAAVGALIWEIRSREYSKISKKAMPLPPPPSTHPPTFLYAHRPNSSRYNLKNTFLNFVILYFLLAITAFKKLDLLKIYFNLKNININHFKKELATGNFSKSQSFFNRIIFT